MKIEAYTSDTTMSKFINIKSVEANILGKILPKDIAKMVETYVYRVYNIYGVEVIYANGVYKIKNFSIDEKDVTDNKYNIVEFPEIYEPNEYAMKHDKFYLGEVGTLYFDQAVYVFSRAISKILVDICVSGYTTWDMLEINEKFNVRDIFAELCCNFNVDNETIIYKGGKQEMYENYNAWLEKRNDYLNALYDRVKQHWE